MTDTTLTCTHRLGDNRCGAPAVVRYQPGWRCAAHDLRVLAGLPPLPTPPGIRGRGVAG